MHKKFFLFVIIASLVALTIYAKYTQNNIEEDYQLFSTHTVQKITQLLNHTPESLEELVTKTHSTIKADIQKLEQIQELTYNNVFNKLDHIYADLGVLSAILETIMLTTGDDTLRNTAQKLIETCAQFFLENLSLNHALYTQCARYKDNNYNQEALTPEQKHFIDHVIRTYTVSGIDKPQEIREQIAQESVKISNYTTKFEKNISQDTQTITATKAELAGVPEHTLNRLKKTPENLYIITTDNPTVTSILDNCSCQETRKRVYRLYNKRAWPHNCDILSQLLNHCARVAELTDFENPAQADLCLQMAETTKTVEQFLANLSNKLKDKAHSELVNLINTVDPSLHEPYNPWDLAYTQNIYKKQELALDEEHIAEYFPLEHVFSTLFDFYQKFLNITCTDISEQHDNNNLWHESVKIIQITDITTKEPIGIILLDFFPRAHKYTHACMIPFAPSYTYNNTIHPGCAIILANFTPADGNKPVLLKRREVETLLHEMGHVLHGLLSTSPIRSQAGVATPIDFVETPSQFFENLMYNKNFLQKLTCHHKTQEPLDAQTIDTICSLKNFMQASFVQRQVMLSELSLTLYKEPKSCAKTVREQLSQKHLPYIICDEQNHMECSFGHLANYKAKYYSYLWSLMYAVDLFVSCYDRGLTYAQSGKAFREIILAPGNSRPIKDIVHEFLGRELDINTFLRDRDLL
jgi:Zn-dependent oligopeptidase